MCTERGNKRAAKHNGGELENQHEKKETRLGWPPTHSEQETKSKLAASACAIERIALSESDPAVTASSRAAKNKGWKYTRKPVPRVVRVEWHEENTPSEAQTRHHSPTHGIMRCCHLPAGQKRKGATQNIETKKKKTHLHI